MNLICPDSSSNFLYLFDTTHAPTLFFYSYIPILLISILFGIFVLVKDKYSLQSKLFLTIAVLFSLHLLNETIQWISVPAGLVHFGWQLSALFQTTIFVFSYYFVYVFVQKNDLSFSKKILLMIAIAPVLFALPSTYNMESFDLANCEAINGVFWNYVYVFEVDVLFFSLYLCIKKYFSPNQTKDVKRQIILLAVGVFIFLGIFTITNIASDITLFYEINLLGPLGMFGFLALLSYMIVKFKTFNIKLLGSQMLIAVLFCLVFAMFFVRRIENVKYTLAFTLIFIVILGRSLIRGVKKEVESREKIEELAASLVKSNDKLEGANVKLKELDKLKSEFLSLASHQIRNPLTAIKGYASLVLDGTYGEVSQSVREAVDRMYQSTQSLVVIVGDFLDISRIEQGTMKYDFTSFDIKKLAEQVVGEFKPNIMKAGLTISSVAGPGDYFINADQGKIKQVIGNLIDNAIKYTPTGSIKVALSRHSLSDGTSGRVRVTVSDTGVGIDKDVIPQLFAKFTRDKDAFKTNVSGTGLGLYLAKQMMQAHHGKIWAESDGKGKGSRFIIELDSIR
jgi:signal transduction histidine kinase